MAVDTLDKRASAIGVNAIYARVYPTPDGALDTLGDRQHVGLSYRLADEEAGGGGSYHRQGHDIGITGYSRSWSNP